MLSLESRYHPKATYEHECNKKPALSGYFTLPERAGFLLIMKVTH